MQGPPRTGAYCLIVSIYNVWVRVCVRSCMCVCVSKREGVCSVVM